MIKRNLVFDLGFHNGDDTDFYLKKGFTVVALEADPALVNAGITRFKEAIARKKLFLIHKAVSDVKGKQKFYINPNKSDWSSCHKRLAEIDGSKAKVVLVETTSLLELCKKFGTPTYAKVDIEGYDVFVAKELYNLKEKPPYISFETSKQTYDALFSWLYVSGYTKFQLVNQSRNPERTRPIQKEHEGKNIDYTFTAHSSGFFGKDLPAHTWLSFDEALTRYMKYKELKIIDNQELALGWLDLHAKL